MEATTRRSLGNCVNAWLNGNTILWERNRSFSVLQEGCFKETWSSTRETFIREGRFAFYSVCVRYTNRKS